ncbi:hypothetical protein [Capnocytophaga sp. oral taxon 903]|uniref:hypothetical protein n=1 Tax=Capnocytophaga sp. oral taxon 903 TaxID=2748317 RepID=UPI0015B7F450|nr:hypothetical protein [Capnocytophaga sp. oral taxon 903]NWO29254.1 hypothetical protein [Capnocytophaga sp. oral taxon 903]
MKKLLLSLLLCATVSAFSQEKETVKDSIPYNKWAFQMDAGLGLAEMVSSNFQMRGDIMRIQMRVLYSPEKNARLEMGLGVSEFSQGSFQQSESNYAMLRVSTLDVPLRLAVVTPVSPNIGIVTGAGLHLSAPLWRQFKTQDVNNKGWIGGTVNLGYHLFGGIDLYASDHSKLAIFGEIGGSFWNKGNYITRYHAVINFSYIYTL